MDAEDSDSEGITMESEWWRVQAPSHIAPEPDSDIRSINSNSPSYLPSDLDPDQENSPTNSVHVGEATESNIVQGWPKRITTGKYTNPFHLPRSVNYTTATSISNLQVLQTIKQLK